MSTDPPRSRPERLLRSVLGGGVLYLGLFLVVHAYLAVTSGGLMWTDPLVLALTGVPQTVLVLRRRLDLPTPTTWAIAAMLVAAAAIGVWTLPPGHDAEGYAAWFFGAITFNLLGLALVGRFVTAWAVLAAVAAIAVTWSVLTGLGPGVGIGLVVRHAATLIIGTALAMGLRRSNAAFAAFRAAERSRATEERAAHARAVARRTGAETILEQAGPMLRAVAEGRTLTPSDRREMLVVEGALRDGIRTPRLTRGPLLDAAADARRRGVNVLLLDESPDASTEVRDRAVAWLAAELRGTGGSRFVGRLRTTDEGTSVSAVTDDGQRALRLDGATFPTVLSGDPQEG